MRSKFLLLRRCITMILGGRHYSSRPIRCDGHMNELPVPRGSWDVYYKKQQKFYKKTLIAGALWWLFSLVMMLWTGALYLNWGPPLQPGPPTEAVEECTDQSCT